MAMPVMTSLTAVAGLMIYVVVLVMILMLLIEPVMSLEKVLTKELI